MDHLLRLIYLNARSGEARARLEECFAIARLNISMNTALKESHEILEHLEAALADSPSAKEKLMNGELF